MLNSNPGKQSGPSCMGNLSTWKLCLALSPQGQLFLRTWRQANFQVLRSPMQLGPGVGLGQSKGKTKRREHPQKPFINHTSDEAERPWHMTGVHMHPNQSKSIEIHSCILHHTSVQSGQHNLSIGDCAPGLRRPWRSLKDFQSSGGVPWETGLSVAKFRLCSMGNWFACWAIVCRHLPEVSLQM